MFEAKAGKAVRISTLTFTGNDKNPDQVLILGAELKPLANTGGMGDVVAELPIALRKRGIDARVMIPYYNEGPYGIRKDENNYYYYLRDDNKKQFELEEVCSTTFDHGVRTELFGKPVQARLFKLKTPVNNDVPTYLVYSPEISSLKREYGEAYNDGHMFSAYTAFSIAAVKLMKELAKVESENGKDGKPFNPKTVHCHDWHSAFAIQKIREFAKTDRFYNDIHTAYTFHNAGFTYQGRTSVSQAALNLLNPDEIKKLMQDTEFENELVNIGALVVARTDSGNLYGKYGDQMKKLDAIVLSKFDEARLPVIDEKQTGPSGEETVVKRFNASLIPINDKDTVAGTVSMNYAHEAKTMPSMAEGLNELFSKKNILGIVNGLDLTGMNPNAPERGYNYTTYSASDPIKKIVGAKAANKKAVMEFFSTYNVPKKSFGQLDPEKIQDDGPLIVSWSRFDWQKGQPITLAAAKTFLKKHQTAKLIISADKQSHIQNEEVTMAERLIKEINEDPDCRGRFVFTYDRLPMFKAAVAGADMALFTSRFEPCGLTQLQSMKMGTIPVVSDTGGLPMIQFTILQEIQTNRLRIQNQR